jgi:hypothetical protein
MTIRDPSTQSEGEAAEPHLFRHRSPTGGIEVEETSGVIFAEATGRAAVPPRTPAPRAPGSWPAALLTVGLVAGALAGLSWRRRAERT